jgi:hypothetical protein
VPSLFDQLGGLTSSVVDYVIYFYIELLLNNRIIKLVLDLAFCLTNLNIPAVLLEYNTNYLESNNSLPTLRARASKK